MVKNKDVVVQKKKKKINFTMDSVFSLTFMVSVKY